jgi:hypothetical protein
VVTRWKVFLAAAVIFITGAITGGLLVRNFAPRIVRRTHVSPPVPLSSQRRQEYLGKLDRELDLTPEQHSKAESILAASQARMKRIWEPVEPQIKEEYRRTRREISDMLNPGQREKMKQWHNDREQRRRGGDTNRMSSEMRSNLNNSLLTNAGAGAIGKQRRSENKR